MPLEALLPIGFFAGASLGFLLGWLLARGKAPGDARLENELRQQIAQRESALKELHEKLSSSENAQAAAEARREAAEKLQAELDAMHKASLSEIRETFKALSADALSDSVDKLQKAAEGNLKPLVEPLKQQLEAYQSRLQQSETAQASTLGEVKKQLEMLAQQSQSLAQETQQFRMVLKSNQARGKWGEETLRRVVEAAGMSRHCDFTEQTQAGDAKPDLVVRLPGDRVIIVDAKVPDLDFLSALETADPVRREEKLEQHAAKLKSTIKALADRDYPGEFPDALDYVILFLPAESLFSAALEGDRDLIVWAAERKILLATPASLIALLRSVAVSWQQFAQTENAREIAEAAKELYARVAKFTEHFAGMGDGLDRARKAYNEAIGSYEHRVLPAGERLEELGGAPHGKELADARALDAPLRLPPSNS